MHTTPDIGTAVYINIAAAAVGHAAEPVSKGPEWLQALTCPEAERTQELWDCIPPWGSGPPYQSPPAAR